MSNGVLKAFAACAAVSLTSCQISPQKVGHIESETDYSRHTCDDLARVKAAIEAKYVELRLLRSSPARRKFQILNGETLAVNDAIRIKDCKIPSVRIPGYPKAEERRMRTGF